MSALRIMKFYVGESGVKKPISTIKTLSFFTPLCPNQAFLKKNTKSNYNKKQHTNANNGEKKIFKFKLF